MKTEQTPKLDVKTLEYVLSIADKKTDKYKERSVEAKENGFMVTAETERAKWLSTLCFRNEIEGLIREQEQQTMAKEIKSYPVKTAEDAFKLVSFALDMEIVKKDIARQDMEEKGDVWEVDRYTYEIDGLKSFEQLLTKLIEMQK